jgi:NSS family neurotransmitter:Na+ symporter
MPLFFLLLVVLSVFSMYSGWESGGTQKALDFMFNADISKINGEVAVSALGQAFFSLGLGMAMMIAYGSYLPKSVSIPQSAVIIGISDSLVALFAGLAIFPIVFHFGLDFEAGAGLFFQTLPTALIATPAGNLIGAAFFCMAFFAALTTSVALLEPTVAYVAEQFKISKPRSAAYSGVIMILIGLGCLYSMTFLNFLDSGLTAPLLLPFSALLIVLFVGWRLDKKIISNELNNDDVALGKFLLIMTRYVAPVMISIIMISGVYDRYF